MCDNLEFIFNLQIEGACELIVGRRGVCTVGEQDERHEEVDYLNNPNAAIKIY